MVQAWCDNILQYFISTVISLLQNLETKDLTQIVSVHLFNPEKLFSFMVNLPCEILQKAIFLMGPQNGFITTSQNENFCENFHHKMRTYNATTKENVYTARLFQPDRVRDPSGVERLISKESVIMKTKRICHHENHFHYRSKMLHTNIKHHLVSIQIHR